MRLRAIGNGLSELRMTCLSFSSAVCVLPLARGTCGLAMKSNSPQREQPDKTRPPGPLGSIVREPTARNASTRRPSTTPAFASSEGRGSGSRNARRPNAGRRGRGRGGRGGSSRPRHSREGQPFTPVERGYRYFKASFVEDPWAGLTARHAATKENPEEMCIDEADSANETEPTAGDDAGLAEAGTEIDSQEQATASPPDEGRSQEAGNGAYAAER